MNDVRVPEAVAGTSFPCFALDGSEDRPAPLVAVLSTALRDLVDYRLANAATRNEYERKAFEATGGNYSYEEALIEAAQEALSLVDAA